MVTHSWEGGGRKIRALRPVFINYIVEAGLGYMRPRLIEQKKR